MCWRTHNVAELRVVRKIMTTMGRVCAFPNCPNKMTNNTPLSFHRLPLMDGDVLKLWLFVLHIDANTPVHALRLADLRVCSDHFDREDYCQPKRRRHPIPKHFFLKKTAVPRVKVMSPAKVTVLASMQSSKHLAVPRE